MEISKSTIKQELVRILEKVFQLPEVDKVMIRDIEIFASDENDKIDDSIDVCYHDVLSDIDVGIFVTLHPEDLGNGHGYHSNPERIGLTRECYLGLAYSDGNEGLFQMFRLILKSGIRFDIGFYITVDETKPIYLIPQTEIKEIKEEGKVWPRWDLKKADNFWFVQILSLAKLKRGDYLIADHLANMQLNETLVAQMLERDDFYGTTFHRYGYHEHLEYRTVDRSGFSFVEKDETYNMIAHKIYSVALAYDRLIKRSNPEYDERSNLFFEIWKEYDAKLDYE
jgi:hypothetical protein